jgi:hypothetical protein
MTVCMYIAGCPGALTFKQGTDIKDCEQIAEALFPGFKVRRHPGANPQYPHMLQIERAYYQMASNERFMMTLIFAEEETRR